MLTPLATVDGYFGALTPGQAVGIAVEDDKAGLVRDRDVAVDETTGC